MKNPKQYYPRWGIALDDDILRGVGRVALFAATFEQQLQELYWYYAGISKDIGVIITESIKPKTLMESILKFANKHEQNKRRIADLKDIAEKYTNCGEQRNSIIHWHWSTYLVGQHKLSSPHTTKNKPSKKVTVEQLDRLADEFGDLARRAGAHAISDCSHQSHPRLWPVPWLDKP